MSAHAIARRFGRLDRFRLLGSTGFVSDDTEQSALIAHCLLRHPEDPVACAAAFREELLAWFARLPWGVGLATVKASLRIAFRARVSGVPSAGNGAAMRSALIGVYHADHPELRRAFGEALARVTHTDSRAVEGALFVAEVAAALSQGHSPSEAAHLALAVVENAPLRNALSASIRLVANGATTEEAAAELRTTGYVLHTIPYALFCLLRGGTDPLTQLSEALSSGGDTDSYGAIIGAWLGSQHGAAHLPNARLNQIHDGPFGPTHLRALAAALADCRSGHPTQEPGFSQPAALARNLALMPVVLAHGFRRLLP